MGQWDSAITLYLLYKIAHFNVNLISFQIFLHKNKLLNIDVSKSQRAFEFVIKRICDKRTQIFINFVLSVQRDKEQYFQ